MGPTTPSVSKITERLWCRSVNSSQPPTAIAPISSAVNPMIAAMASHLVPIKLMHSATANKINAQVMVDRVPASNPISWAR